MTSNPAPAADAKRAGNDAAPVFEWADVAGSAVRVEEPDA